MRFEDNNGLICGLNLNIFCIYADIYGRISQICGTRNASTYPASACLLDRFSHGIWPRNSRLSFLLIFLMQNISIAGLFPHSIHSFLTHVPNRSGASLMSVCWSVGWSVGQSVGLSYFPKSVEEGTLPCSYRTPCYFPRESFSLTSMLNGFLAFLPIGLLLAAIIPNLLVINRK